jgi:hypothetical protein
MFNIHKAVWQSGDAYHQTRVVSAIGDFASMATSARSLSKALDGARHRSKIKIVINQTGGWLIA